MASMGSGYDLSVATFSPDGRVFQVEYAAKAVDVTGLTIGAVCNDGVLLAVDKYLSGKLMVPTSNSRVFIVAAHVICAVAGSLPDARQLVSRARTECAEYEKIWGIPIPANVLVDRLGLFVHGYTSVWSTRPFGCSILIGVRDTVKTPCFPVSGTFLDFASRFGSKLNEEETQPVETHSNTFSLWNIDPTGAAYKYAGTAIGKGTAAAKSGLERLDLLNLSCKDAINEFAKILHQGHAEIPEKQMHIEMVGIHADHQGTMVAQHVIDRANQHGAEYIQRMEVE